MQELLKKPLPAIPSDIQDKLNHSKIALTTFEDLNAVLMNMDLQQEAGYQQFPDGSWLVSMYCPMPGITKEMIDWWFWWHTQKDLRYQVWFPGSHSKNSYARKDRAYFEQETQPEFQPNSQFPVEEIGGSTMPLRIDFVTPQSFGFTKDALEWGNIATVVCGHVSAFGGLIPHTEMAHIYKQAEDGLFMFSRFWMGTTMHPLLRKFVMTEKMARGMAEHCCIEYRNLAEILPGLYQKYCK